MYAFDSFGKHKEDQSVGAGEHRLSVCTFFTALGSDESCYPQTQTQDEFLKSKPSLSVLEWDQALCSSSLKNINI